MPSGEDEGFPEVTAGRSSSFQGNRTCNKPVMLPIFPARETFSMDKIVAFSTLLFNYYLNAGQDMRSQYVTALQPLAPGTRWRLGMSTNRSILTLWLRALLLAGVTLISAGRVANAHESSRDCAGPYKPWGIPAFMQMAGKTESDTAQKHGALKGPKDDQTGEVSVISIDFRAEADGTEKVFIGLNRHYIPQIFALQGDKPRIVIDIKNVSTWKGRHKIPVNGKLIRQIRTHLHRRTKTLRLVLDLNLLKDYTVSPAFYPTENVYCIGVRPK